MANTPGVKRPCTKRQAINCERVVDVAERPVTSASATAEPTITRLRPIRSATRPMTGAPRATATVDAVTVRLTARWDALNTRIRSGSSGWVAYKSRNAVKPASTIGKVRGRDIALYCLSQRRRASQPREGVNMNTRPFLATVLAVTGLFVCLHAQTPAPVTAFTGLRLIDGTDRAPLPNATIVVRDGRIAAVGAAGAVTVPDGAARVDLTGKTVIPGLINAHGHINDLTTSTAALRTYAAYGVTTVFSLGDEPASAFTSRSNQNTPALARSRVFLAGPVIAANTPEEARAQVAKNAAQKVDIIKIRVDDNLGTTAKMTPAVYRAVIEEAHQRGLRVAVHIFYLEDAKGVLEAGADFIAHSVRDADISPAVITLLKSRDICLCPTLMREVSTFVYESTPDFFTDPFFLKNANLKWVADLKQPAQQEAMRKSPSAQRYKAALDVASKNLNTLVSNGVTIAMGTDTGPVGRFQGFFELKELELMGKAG